MSMQGCNGNTFVLCCLARLSKWTANACQVCRHVQDVLP